jgi:hypothetical protein
MAVVARAASRIFVGLPMCKQLNSGVEFAFILLDGPGRNEEYLNLAEQFSIDVLIRAQVIDLLPTFLQPSVPP